MTMARLDRQDTERRQAKQKKNTHSTTQMSNKDPSKNRR